MTDRKVHFKRTKRLPIWLVQLVNQRIGCWSLTTFDWNQIDSRGRGYALKLIWTRLPPDLRPAYNRISLVDLIHLGWFYLFSREG